MPPAGAAAKEHSSCSCPTAVLFQVILAFVIQLLVVLPSRRVKVGDPRGVGPRDGIQVDSSHPFHFLYTAAAFFRGLSGRLAVPQKALKRR